MRKLPLLITGSVKWEEKVDELCELRRLYHSIIFTNFTFFKPNILRAIEGISKNVRQLEFNEVIIMLKSFEEIFNSCPMLEEVSFFSCNSDGKYLTEIKETRMKCLKKLTIVRSDFSLFEYFTKSQTQVENLDLLETANNESDTAYFENFLKIQKNLQRLSIKNENYFTFEPLIKNENKFKLKSFKVMAKYQGMGVIDSNWEKILQFHKSSLENLEFRQFLTENLLEFIVKNLKINRFVIEQKRSSDSSWIQPRFSSSICPNLYLKTLVLCEDVTTVAEIQELIRLFPAIEKLVIKNWREQIINDIIVFIANHLKNLKHLEIPHLSSETPELTFPSIKTLQVNYVDNVNEWKAIVMNNPTIENLFVIWNHADLFSYEVLDVVSQRLPGLRNLKFGPQFKTTKRINEMMKRNCPNLVCFEILNQNEENFSFSYENVSQSNYSESDEEDDDLMSWDNNSDHDIDPEYEFDGYHHDWFPFV